MEKISASRGLCAGLDLVRHRQGVPSPRWIDRMARIERPSIETNIRAKAAPLDEALGGVVTPLAQAHERAEPEFIDVAAMRLNMAADLGRDYDAALQAITAERLLAQLVLPDPRPAPRAVPSILLRRLAANAHSAQPII